MPNKTKIILLLVLVIVALLIFTNKKGPATENTNQVSNVTTMENGTYKINTMNSNLMWQGQKLAKVWIDKGSIKLADGEITIADKKLTGGHFVVDMTTIAATETGKGDGQDKLSGHLKSKDFFDVEQFPTATFKITNVVPANDNTYNVTGEMSIRNIVNTETVLAIMTENGISGEFKIDRSKYEVKFGSSKFFQNLGENVVDDNFTLKFNLVW